MALVKEADVFESWEDMDEAQLERQEAEYRARRAAEDEAVGRPARSSPIDASSRGGGLDGCSAPLGGAGVRILKRPTGSGGAGANGDNRQRPVRSLLQRQQDYEAARLRIMGQAKCPDDADNSSQIKVEPVRIQNGKARDKPETSDFQPTRLACAPPNGISVLRTPRLPDDTKGFNLRR